jgi:hypothetical protein
VDLIEAAENTERKMPIQATGELNLRARRGERVVIIKQVPFALFAGEAVERQSQRNHGQTVERIAERGGYSACEALAVIAGLDWDRVSKLDEEAAHRILYNMHVAYNRGRRWGLAVHETT